MTRYDPEWEGGTMDPHPTGDYVRYEVAQALKEALEAIVAFNTPLPAGLLEQARAALALAEKKGDA